MWLSISHVTNDENFDQERIGYAVNAEMIFDKKDFESKETDMISMMSSGMVDINGFNTSTNEINNHLSTKIHQGLNRCSGENSIKVRVRIKYQEIYLDVSLDPSVGNTKDVIYLIPRGEKPVNEYANPSHIACLYPNLFPYGCGILEDPSRPISVGFKDHVQYLLSYEDKRFETNYSFIYVVFNILQKRNACYGARLMMSRPYFAGVAQQLNNVKVEEINEALQNIEDKSYRPDKHKNVDLLLRQIRTISGNVMGSSQSRTSLRIEIHSLIYRMGLPNLFITINPADIHHPVNTVRA